ncbi:MAG TPA: hypothetical protein VGM76_15745 [Lacipirellulaceae bacterium]|jgi:hypothetical protein
MRSIPLAMTWEIFARARWALLAAALAGIAFPALIIALLRHEGQVDPQDPSWLLLNIVLVQINAFLFGAAVLGGQGKVSQLYAYPLSTPKIVAWRLLPLMVAIALETCFYTWGLNSIFLFHWPLWGPALSLAVAFAAVQAAVWLTEKSLWTFVSLFCPVIVFCIWFKTRYGFLMAPPTHLWLEVTPSEVLAMLMAATLAYGVAIYGVARNRRGEPPFSLGIISWLVARFETPANFKSPFRTAERAQAWYEWRAKGWMMPVLALIGLLVASIIWLCVSRRADDLFQGVLGCGGFFLILAFIFGLVMGNVASGTKADMGQCFATHPITSTVWARIILQTAALSALVTWAIWIVAVAAIYGILAALRMTDQIRTLEVPRALGWRYFPAVLIGSWTLVGLGASLMLLGRPTLMFKLLSAVVIAPIAYTLLAKFALSYDAVLELDRFMAAAMGAVSLLATAWLFAWARRRSLIEWATVCAAASAWALASTLVMRQLPPAQLMSLPLLLLVVTGLCALVIAPLAAAPLAISWNRNR